MSRKLLEVYFLYFCKAMYIFNPDNDLALANFKPHFTAPASARKMRHDLSMLPVWYAPKGSKIIVEGEINRGYMCQINRWLPLNQSLVFPSEIQYHNPAHIIPWGWNPTIRRQLIEWGVESETLPTPTYIKMLRHYAGRQNAVKLLKELKDSNSAFCGESFVFPKIEWLLSYLDHAKADQVLKMPLSGSGKGLVWIKGAITDKQIDWCNRVIRKQGGVVVEPVLNKIQDFAMEFEKRDGDVYFRGYSLFRSAVSGAYEGNVLLSDDAIEDKLSEFVDREEIRVLKKTLVYQLKKRFLGYNGILGVDMMICKHDTKPTYQIHPCVEVNLRMNMGLVAHRIYERFVHPKATGMFSINFFKQTAEAKKYSLSMEAKHPLVIERDKIKSGFLALTPIDDQTQYIATVSVKQNHEK